MAIIHYGESEPVSNMGINSLATKTKIVIFLVTIGAAMAFVVAPVVRTSHASPLIEPTATPSPSVKAAREVRPRRYSQFPHNIKRHSAECSSCHKFPSDNWKSVRKDGEAFPDITDYPKHASCINCHKQQFFSGRPPVICSICHTNPGPRNSKRHPFPNPREVFDNSPKGKNAESDFSVKFPHEIHVDIVSGGIGRSGSFVNASWEQSPAAEESCAVCHKTMAPQGEDPVEFLVKPPAAHGDAFWLKKGTFKTSPIGHTTCFTCHNAESGLSPAPNDCAKCHKLKQPIGPTDFDAALAVKMGATQRVMRDAWRTRTSSGTFRHEWSSHADLSCSTCHDVSKLVTNDQKTLKVPIASCNMCHITATSDEGGVLNYEVDQRKKDPGFSCVKCHVTYGKRPIPESHIKAISDAGK